MAFNDSTLVMPGNPNAALAEERTEWRIGELEIGEFGRKKSQVRRSEYENRPVESYGSSLLQGS
jgi:hypothetical protein